MHTFRGCLFLPVLLGSLLVTNAGLADEVPVAIDESPKPAAAGPETAFPLPEIIISARRIDAPNSIIVREVSREDISAWNAHTAGDALTFVPGVNVQVGGTSADARAWIRGFRDRDVLVLYDGIPIASGFEGTIDLNEISLAKVRDIKVMKSAPSVIYGTNGMGGVIDVIPETEIYNNYFLGGAEMGTDDKLLVGASAGGGNGQFSYGVSASHQQADDYSLSSDFVAEVNQPEGTRVNSDFKRSSLFLNLDAQETFLGHSSIFLNISDAEKGLPVQTGIDDPDYQRLTKSTRTTLGLSNRFSGFPLTAQLYYNSYDSDLTTYTDGSFNEVDEVESAEDYSVGGKLYATLETSSNNQLIISGGSQKDIYEAEGEFEHGSKAELVTWTLALEDQYWINERLSLAAGIIHTYFDQTRLNETSSATNPQVALAWQASPKLSVHASAAQRTRFPKLRELYRRRFGNPDLEEQTANNYELGARLEHQPGWTSDFAVFRSDIDDLIERPDRDSVYLNLDRVTLSGVELASRGWLNEKLFAGVGYTYVDASEELADGTSRQLRSRPKHTTMLELRYRISSATMISVNSIHVSGLYDLDDDDVYSSLSSYFVCNAKVSTTFAGRWEPYLAVSNLFDENYLQRLGDPREGRLWMAGIDFEF